MTVHELSRSLDTTPIAGASGLENPVTGCYIGDLLSWVMSRLEEGNAWVTVMGNVNAIAVAKLADAACVILCEGAHLDDEAKAQADANGVPVLSAPQPAFQLAGLLRALLEPS